jgi:hypothetical protein
MSQPSHDKDPSGCQSAIAILAWIWILGVMIFGNWGPSNTHAHAHLGECENHDCIDPHPIEPPRPHPVIP